MEDSNASAALSELRIPRYVLLACVLLIWQLFVHLLYNWLIGRCDLSMSA
jgi:hypothetical protein